MGNFFTSLFSSSKPAEATEDKAKNEQKNFDILKYDGVRAQKMGKLVYAIKCFTEALNIQEDFETMSYLVSAYTMANDLGKAEDVLNRMVEMEPDHIATRLTRVNLLFMLDKDAEVITDCLHVIELEPSNHVAYFMMAKAKKATNDVFGAIADLTRSIFLKEDFADSYLLRAEILLGLGQAKEALPDVEKAIEIVPEEESSYLLRGRIHMALGDIEAANSDFQQVLDLNPFNEDACILSGQLLIEQKKYDEAIAFFDEAIETNPSFAKAYSERGRAKNLKGDKTGAFEDLKKSLELNPEGEEAQKMNGQHSNFDDMYKGGIF
ncbi:tetratricopeptide repeat protein [Parabacteroides sp.]|uniref:tetratricopeptide repeat protein n=1 Tax=Parabacteroides sp. TaxID=1869337 RepID=UPI0025795516|nr:tetratricopeptide repeat protein [Parabacteroides sp.]